MHSIAFRHRLVGAVIILAASLLANGISNVLAGSLVFFHGSEMVEAIDSIPPECDQFIDAIQGVIEPLDTTMTVVKYTSLAVLSFLGSMVLVGFLTKRASYVPPNS